MVSTRSGFSENQLPQVVFVRAMFCAVSFEGTKDGGVLTATKVSIEDGK